MRTRARDYVESPAISKRKKRVAAKSNYLRTELIPVPAFLKSHPTVKPPTLDRQIDQSDIVQLFDNLSISNTADLIPLSPTHTVKTLTPHLYTLTRSIVPVPLPLSSIPFKSSSNSSFNNPDLKIKSPLRTFPSIPLTDTLHRPGSAPTTTMAVPRATAPHIVEEWKTVKFKLGLPKLVCGSADRLLKSDGSNYTDWEYHITRLIETTCGKKGYLDDWQACITDPEGDEVMALIIELSVPVEIAWKLSDCSSA